MARHKRTWVEPGRVRVVRCDELAPNGEHCAPCHNEESVGEPLDLRVFGSWLHYRFCCAYAHVEAPDVLQYVHENPTEHTR